MKAAIFDFFYRLKLINNPSNKNINGLFLITLFSLPFGFMTIRGLFGVLSAACFILSLFIVAANWTTVKRFFKEESGSLIILSLTSMTLAILIGQIIRQEFSFSFYSGPIRLIFALSILVAIYILKIDFSKLISLSLPAALTLIFYYAKSTEYTWGDRLTNHYLDPIFWGNYSMIIGFLCLTSIERKDSMPLKMYKIYGFLLGGMMSILSQSRAGWAAALVLMVTWVFLNRNQLTLKQVFIYLLTIIMSLITLYLTVHSFQIRIDTALTEVITWHNKTQIVTSTGIRLTMWKMTLHFFTLSPWVGYGEYSSLPILNDSYILSFADSESIKTIQCCGPHNEIAAHMLRSGVLGIFALLATYLIPCYLFIKSRSHQTKMMGITLCMGTFICGFGTEMLSLKVSYAFYAIFLSGLMATSLWKDHEKI